LKQIGLFEMRRLEALSNTIFGVAMTLLAYDLPKASRFANAPAWIDLFRAYAQPVIALMISFIIAGVFWLSHHRRLTFAPEGSRGEVFLNLIFLLSIVMLPVTNGLYGVYRLDSVVAASYGFHLTVIASLNALLWILALRGRRNPELLATAMFPVFVLVFGSDGRRCAVHCAIHMVPGIRRASGGLVGGPALAAENELGNLISANVFVCNDYRRKSKPALMAGRQLLLWTLLLHLAIEEIEGSFNRMPGYFWIISVHDTITIRRRLGEVAPDVPAVCRVLVDH
jgi:uncharacterized membrane protein